MRRKMLTKEISEVEKEIEELLTSLDNYGYSREETLADLEKGFETEVSEECYFKWKELRIKLSTLKSCQAKFDRFMKDLKERFELWKLKEFGMAGMSPKFEKFLKVIDELSQREGDEE